MVVSATYASVRCDPLIQGTNAYIMVEIIETKVI